MLRWVYVVHERVSHYVSTASKDTTRCSWNHEEVVLKLLFGVDLTFDVGFFIVVIRVITLELIELALSHLLSLKAVSLVLVRYVVAGLIRKR